MSEECAIAEESGEERRRGRPCKLSPEQVEQLVAITREQPLLAVDDLVAEFRKRAGVRLSRGTVLKYLRDAGVRRARARNDATSSDMEASTDRSSDGASEGGPKPPRRYGYNESHRDGGDESRYPCGLTDAEWEVVEDLFDGPRPGRPPKYDRRLMLDACVYVLRSGCSWRMLPKEFPAWQNVYGSFRRWTAQGLFEQMYDRLRALWRKREERNVSPTAAAIDSQSVKTSPQGGPKGYDAGKKVKGRKRHLVTDTLGLLLALMVTTADVQDRDAAKPLIALAKAKYTTIEKVYADGGYAGKAARDAGEALGVDVEIVRHPANRNVGRWVHPDQLDLPIEVPAARGFVPLPKRWVVERSNAWNERPRRMNRDHDRRLDVSMAWIWLTEGRMLLRRLTATA